MKKIIQTIVMAACLATSSGYALSGEGARFIQSEEAVKQATYGHIDSYGLKSLIESGVSFTLLDARGHKWTDGTQIPGAQLASYEYTEEDLAEMIPDHHGVIVVYCYSFTCPLSRLLADRLVELGYDHVLEYPGGLKEWRDVAQYPTVSIQ